MWGNMFEDNIIIKIIGILASIATIIACIISLFTYILPFKAIRTSPIEELIDENQEKDENSTEIQSSVNTKVEPDENDYCFTSIDETHDYHIQLTLGKKKSLFNDSTNSASILSTLKKNDCIKYSYSIIDGPFNDLHFEFKKEMDNASPFSGIADRFRMDFKPYLIYLDENSGLHKYSGSHQIELNGQYQFLFTNNSTIEEIVVDFYISGGIWDDTY